MQKSLECAMASGKYKIWGGGINFHISLPSWRMCDGVFCEGELSIDVFHMHCGAIKMDLSGHNRHKHTKFEFFRTAEDKIEHCLLLSELKYGIEMKTKIIIS